MGLNTFGSSLLYVYAHTCSLLKKRYFQYCISQFHRISAIMEILSYCYNKPHDVCYIKPPTAFETLLVMLLPFEIGILCHIYPLYFAVTYFVTIEDYTGVLLNSKDKPFCILPYQFLGCPRTSAQNNVFFAVRIH
jgi:hypothetical protein